MNIKNIDAKNDMSNILHSNLKILIADDDVPTRILLRKAISQWGYNVVEAENGEDAWKTLLNNDPPQILILDWMMPIVDGITLCARVRREFTGLAYIILLTQLTGSTNIQQALEAGADEFLSKPFNMVELRNRILIGTRIVSYENMLIKQKELLKTISQNTTAISSLIEEISPKLKSINDQSKEKPELTALGLSENIESIFKELNNISSNIENIKNALSKVSR